MLGQARGAGQLPVLSPRPGGHLAHSVVGICAWFSEGAGKRLKKGISSQPLRLDYIGPLSHLPLDQLGSRGPHLFRRVERMRLSPAAERVLC